MSTVRKPVGRRVDIVQRPGAKIVGYNDAYTFALRVAYLHHLLQPRAKRKQYVTPIKPVRAATTIGDLMKDFSIIGGSKSAKFPHGFMSPLEKRLQGVMVNTERLPGYNDPAVKRSFAEAYNAFTETGFRRRMDKERRVEDLVLIFYSSATRAQQKGKTPDDTSWKLLVDRHVALFVRLISNTLKANGNDRDRPELMTRLASLEKNLLTNAQDLYVNTGQDGETQQVTAPLSYAVKDMRMVQVVAKVFGLTISQVQVDIDGQKQTWTEEAALADLKSYQHCLVAEKRRTLTGDDFESDDAYQSWKKGEGPELSQMILEILQAKPELNKTKLTSPATTPSSPWEDVKSLTLDDTPKLYLEEASYVFIPTDPRAYFKSILGHAMTFDQLHAEPSETLLSKDSIDLLNELCHRWRLPHVSKLVLYLDVATQKFMDQEIGLNELDTAFQFTQTGGLYSPEHSHWPLKDYAQYRQILSSLHDALLRDLYDVLQQAYDTKAPSHGEILLVLNEYIYNDEAFIAPPESLEAYSEQLAQGLRAKAAEVYRGYLEAEIPHSQDEWQFFHVVQLGKAVVKVCQQIQKRYKKNPEVMGVNLRTILVETMFPNFENDAGDLIRRILHVAQTRNSAVELEDGFELYRELVEIRNIHRDALPECPFAFNVEELLADFVWRWIQVADTKMIELVNQAILQDNFTVRTDHADNIPTDDERHSVSIMDIFELFNQTVDQIFQLNWDDDVQYAKFMTALSKSFGVGLARYCEVIEQRFTKEMDRLTPLAEAQAVQTKQERWMQLAKDIWANKEKIEPFQFYAESFVKLNNIEYGIKRLDKLEKSMNVDACADVLNKNTPPKERQRRPSKYVFTIKIVEAESIKACDPNGTSDPYVVLGDEYQKRLAKTRVIMRNLNPRWDESVDITVQGALNIIATIWDWDTFGDHDYVGRTSLKLDPNHFSDYMPREYWLDLDTQGRLLLRVNMEGERDDIQFYFGKAFRLLKRTQRDMTRKITDKLSTFIQGSLSQETLRSLMSRGLTVASVTGLWKNRQSLAMPVNPTGPDKESVLKPLFTYFDENFAIMKQTLTDDSMIMVMTRLWKEVLIALEALLVPPLSDKPSVQRPLSQPEVDIVFFWLQLLFDFFHARDEQTGEAMGVSADVLRSQKYSELKSLNFFYFESTNELIRASERMASETAQRAQTARNRLTAPASLGAAVGGMGPSSNSLLGVGTVRRSKSIMMSRNLGTMRKAKEEKRKEAQADPSDDMILRILRMRPEAANYLRDRSRQKARLATAAAAELIVRQSLASGGVAGLKRASDKSTMR